MVAVAETASGKTLSYLLPILRRFEQNGSQALVLVPSIELMEQLRLVTESLGHKCAVLSPKLKMSGFVPPDAAVCVSTPLLINLNEGWVYDKIIPRMALLVFDEADWAVSRFSNYTQKILENLRLSRKRHRPTPAVLYTGATIPSLAKKSPGALIQYVHRGKVERVQSEKAHKLPSNLDLVFEKFDDKPENMRLDVFPQIRNILKSRKRDRTIIFVNSSQTLLSLVKYLSLYSKDLPSVHQLSKELTEGERLHVLRECCDPKKKGAFVIITTDIASRGIDFAHVSMVISVEFPTDAITFIHRAGRCARSGISGKVISFCNPTHEYLVDAIQKKIQAQESLDSVFSRNRSLRNNLRRYKNRKLKKVKTRQATISHNDSLKTKTESNAPIVYQSLFS
jgi:superfamily II DNA/RNA helicase